MMSIRAALRSAPRNIARFSTSRPVASRFAQTATRAVHSIQSQTSPLAALRSSSLRAFTTSIARREAAGETDDELSAKLESEIAFEKEVKDAEPLPASVKDFLENGPFEINDIPGQEEVTLTRTFGNEKITITFSIADLANYEADEYDEEAAMAEDGLDAEDRPPKPGASMEDAGKDLDEPTDEDMPDTTDADGAVPCRLSIVVEKPGKPGALSIEASAQDGTIVVENLYYFAKAELAHGKTADASHAAQDVYPGPPFGSLDEDLQVLLERYLEERGITQSLAVFVPDYMDAKEQREYSAWLNNLKAFVDA